jgi:hypothetical protein
MEINSTNESLFLSGALLRSPRSNQLLPSLNCLGIYFVLLRELHVEVVEECIIFNQDKHQEEPGGTE